MDRYTIAQRVEIVKIHYTNGEVFAQTMRKVRTAFGRKQAPSRTAVVKLINKFERLGQVTDVKVPKRARKARTPANIAAVARNVIANPDTSISKRSKELGISATTIHRILYKDIGLPVEKRGKKKVEVLPEMNSGIFVGGAAPYFM